ncbi:DUF1064 domain-containing protein [Bacillus velezensis]|uniref:DUF1064 domain-containing protein n=1 Tax=Bacillus velezensis TaxID=492670 RepID=UPI000B605A1B|nr:DUF1064 domain-containing protein [Bacillus velezensis]ASB52578.1 hypothetical protein S100072_01242 [Bacillus velezensis]QMT25879.1 DUF1064 domain-containing protein [Bacillus velezensis]WJN55871.1 DUF1064 domain-containing protein [Bacillus velezensis]
MQTNKYGARKTQVDGITFDSRAEAKYYEQLKWYKAFKQIKDFKLQPRFLLQEAFKKNGKTFRKIEYIADFEVHNLDGSIEIIDIKGVETKEFAIKRKLYERLYEMPLKVLALDKSLGFIELDELKKLKRKAGKTTAKSGNRRRSTVVGAGRR